MKKQFAVIGMGRFGTEVAVTLAKNGQEVIAIDKDEKRIKDVADTVSVAVVLDAMDDKALNEAGVKNVDVAVVSMGQNIEATILAIMILKEMGVHHIVAKAVNDLFGRVLTQLGVSKVIQPERDMAQKLAHSLINPEFLEFIELSPEFSIVEVPPSESFVDRTIADIDPRRKHNISIIAIKSRDQERDGEYRWNINPVPSNIIRPGDVMVLLGANKDLEKFSSQS